jgi:hypothetical protein
MSSFWPVHIYRGTFCGTLWRSPSKDFKQMKEGSDSEQSNGTDPKMATARVIHPKPLNEVRPEEWEEIWGRLRLYVKANFDYVRKYGLSPDDIAQEVVANTIGGRRRWPAIDRSSHVSLRGGGKRGIAYD